VNSFIRGMLPSPPLQRRPAFNPAPSSSGKGCVPASCPSPAPAHRPWGSVQQPPRSALRTVPGARSAEDGAERGMGRWGLLLGRSLPPLPPAPHVPTCPQTLQLRSIFSAWELLQGGDISSQQLQTSQQSSTNTGEVPATLLAAL